VAKVKKYNEQPATSAKSQRPNVGGQRSEKTASYHFSTQALPSSIRHQVPRRSSRSVRRI